MNRILLLFLFTLFSTAGFSQQDLLMGGYIFGGIPFNSYEQNKSVLAPRTMTSQLGYGLNLQYRLFKRLGIEAGIGHNAQFRKFKDKDFENRNKDFMAKINSYNYYWSCYGALQYNQPLSDYSFIYGKAGYVFNYFQKDKVTKTENFIVTDENVTMTNNYQDKNYSWFLEAGVETYLSDNVLFNIGLRLNKGLSEMISGTYEVEQNGSVISSDAFSSDGTFLALSTGLKFTLYHKDKRKKVKRVKQIEEPVEVIQQPELVDTVVEGRELKVAKTISVAKPAVIVRVWDNEKVDGDIVSIKLNDSWIIENYTLKKEKKEIQVSLKAGRNILVLHALNLGELAPNTAAVSIDDGHKTQKLILSSNLNESGTLIIEYKP